MLLFPDPIPVTTEYGEGVALYARDNGSCWTVLLSDRTLKTVRIDELTITKGSEWDFWKPRKKSPCLRL